MKTKLILLAVAAIFACLPASAKKSTLTREAYTVVFDGYWKSPIKDVPATECSHKMTIDERNKKITLVGKTTQTFKIVSATEVAGESEIEDDPVIYTYNCTDSKNQKVTVKIDGYFTDITFPTYTLRYRESMW